MSDTAGSNNKAKPRGRGRKRAVLVAAFGVLRFVVVVALIAGGVAAAYWFNNAPLSTPQSEQEDRGEASRLVEVDTVEIGPTPVRVRAMGTVMPAREAVVRPRVAGAIVEQSDRFVPGGFFEAGAFMVQIERTDYEQTIEQRQSDLARAEAALQIELGDQAVAREELELLEIDIPEINRELILRVPQVNQAKAEVRSAEAALKRAKLDLDRTRIVAPFTGHIVERDVNIGNNVSPGDALATFVGADEYWVELTLPVSGLRWFETGDGSEPGSVAVVDHERAWGPGVTRRGAVAQRIGRLEQGSRLARVLVSVPDPLAREPENEGMPELMLGAFVGVEIVGKTLPDAAVIDRDLVRDDDTVWTMGPDDRLITKRIEIVYRGPDTVYVTSGLEAGDRVVRTNLTAPVEGMLLRVAGDEQPAASPVADAAGGGATGG
jgi:RND family efflux transporter MFP subunit